MSYTNFYSNSHLLHCSMRAMATQFDLIMIGEETHTMEVWQRVETEIQRLERMMSRYDSNSELYRLNEEIAHYPTEVGDELWNILLECREYYEQTEHLFDITLGGFSQLLFDMEKHTLYSFSDSVRLDLGGYGKGYTLKKISSILQENKIDKALVNFGNSSVLAVGSHPFGENWPIGIENPFTHQKVIDINLYDNSLSASGNTPRHPHHVINPLTGKYVEGKCLAVAISKNPVLAEVMTTMMLIADETQCERILNKYNEISEKHIYDL